ncbi:MAG TPA: prepilin-type N-terminal cleavage/methylation domain-containing protein, partial [Synergistetes bacterium]|nr:prepilin-type N-terminal cleavage/methylation domain-containing protein [Synergistota bacterium]
MRMRGLNAGFTLLELIISLTIIAVIVTVIQNGFQLGVRAWEKGESAIEGQQRYRYVLALMARQLGSCHPSAAIEIDGEDDSGALFKGDEASMAFTSKISLVPGDPPGTVRVRYRIETDDEGWQTVSFSERRAFSTPGTVSQETLEEENRHTLLSHIRESRFDYLAAPSADALFSEESSWQSSWQPARPNQAEGLPHAVRMRFQVDEKAAPL